MGTPLQTYGQYLVSINGKIAAQQTAVDFGVQNSDTNVLTMPLGFAGMTPSPKMLQCSVKLAAPTVGNDLPSLKKMEDDEKPVKLGILQTGDNKRLLSEGYIRNVKGNSSVGASSEISFDFEGTNEPFQ